MLFKQKCPGCGKKVERKFNFCPYCGMSFKQYNEEQGFGMLGTDDNVDLESQMKQEIKLPFGMNKIMNSLMKQLEKQMSELDDESDVRMPKGFKIQISTGMPQMKRAVPVRQRIIDDAQEISDKESERRRFLPREEAESAVRRLSDRIIYELKVKGVKSKKDIMIRRLENSLEIKAYSKDRCYYKIIPLKVEIMGYYLKDDKLFVELKD